jgi:hypothetical protein
VSLSPYDRAVGELTARGFSRDRAEAAVREQLRLSPIPDPDASRKDSILEKAEQIEIRKRFIVCGFTVYNLSQARAAKQTPGLPDLWLMHPARALALWWESKRQLGGTFSQAQRDFAAASLGCGINYGAGDRYDAERWLIDHELADITDGSFFPRPRQK